MSGFVVGFVACYLSTSAPLFLDGVPEARVENDWAAWLGLFFASLVWPGAFLGRRA